MKLEDLREMLNPDHADIQRCHDIICALEDRLAYAKELLTTVPPKEGAMYVKYFEARAAFIEKLNSENL